MFDRIIIASGDSNRQVKALARSVHDKVKEAGGDIVGMEGEDGGEWVLVDLGDIVVHVMQPAVRAHYNLEELWRGASPSPKGKLERTSSGDGAASPTPTPRRPRAAADAAVTPVTDAPKPRARSTRAPASGAAGTKKPAAKKVAAKKTAAKKPTPGRSSSPTARTRARKPASDAARSDE